MKVAERRKKERVQRRTMVLSTAKNLFHQQGYYNTTIDEIALQAGLGKGTVYYYFGSKEEIFCQVCVNLGRDFRYSIFRAIRHEMNLREQLEILVKEGFQFFIKNAPLFMTFQKELPNIKEKVGLNMVSTVLKNKIISKKLFKRYLTPVLKKENADCDSEILHDLLGSLMIGCSHQFLFSSDIKTIEKNLWRSFEIVYRGLFKCR